MARMSRTTVRSPSAFVPVHMTVTIADSGANPAPHLRVDGEQSHDSQPCAVPANLWDATWDEGVPCGLWKAPEPHGLALTLRVLRCSPDEPAADAPRWPPVPSVRVRGPENHGARLAL